MANIYSYVLRYDDGAAPNPYHDMCTLSICKPVIRRTAQVGDWVIGTGSKNSTCNDGNTYDFSQKLVYAMRISNVMSLQEYDEYCLKNLPGKIPNWESNVISEKMGDCIYDYSVNPEHPAIRGKVHNEGNRKTDVENGRNALLSDYFFYFGENPVELPDDLKILIKTNQGHKKVTDGNLVQMFEEWITKFEPLKLYGDPQLKHRYEKGLTEAECSNCAKAHYEDDVIEDEEVL